MNSEPLYSFPAESFAMRSLVWPIIVLFPALGIACFFALNLAGLLTGFFLIALGLVIVTRIVNEVCFYETEIKVKYYWFNKVVITSYSNIKLVRPTTEPKTWLRIYVADMKQNSKPKKITWYCEDGEFDQLKSLLLKNKVRVTNRE
ncbi:MAG: hypothetical protein ACJAXI_003351 [Crocinitomicaceae bacterium]|jgi:hypothetical protein